MDYSTTYKNQIWGMGINADGWRKNPFGDNSNYPEY